jgi:hypothetical protein
VQSTFLFYQICLHNATLLVQGLGFVPILSAQGKPAVNTVCRSSDFWNQSSKSTR